MIHDLNNDASSIPGSCDVCILGAGPAGIVAALELSRQRPDWHIVVLEGGGTTRSNEQQLDPYQGQSTGAFPYPLAGSRLRFLGGTSNHWGGWCRPLDAEDFAPRAWIARSGWPLPRTELMPWYERAARWCEIESNRYDDASLAAGFGSMILPLADSRLLCHKYFHFSPPTRFGSRYREQLQKATNVTLLLHANATGLEWAGERVRAVAIHTKRGSARRIQPRHVIVALGGIESTRFLLMQAGLAPSASGIASPMLGRCFADHFGRTPAAAILPAELDYTRKNDHPAGPTMPVISLRPEAQEALGTGDFCMTLIPRSKPDGLEPAYADNAALGLGPAKHWNYRLQLTLEPAPNPDSRITLTTNRDSLGMPRLHLEWRLQPSDQRPAVASLQEVASEWGAQGLGRLRLFEEERYAARMPGIGYHHMGSTRMAENTEGGVVDAQCRVHGVENLHVASSSVFPAYGFSNPTLTIVALAARLATRLAGNTGVPS